VHKIVQTDENLKSSWQKAFSMPRNHEGETNLVNMIAVNHEESFAKPQTKVTP